MINSLFRFLTIPKGVLFTGNIDSPFSCIVNGEIVGTIKSKKKVIVRKSGVINGNILAKRVRIEGKCYGDVHAENLTVIKGGFVKGKIIANRITIQEQAMVEDVEEVKTAVAPELAPTVDNKKWF